MTRVALVSVSPSPPTCVVSRKTGAPQPSWKSFTILSRSETLVVPSMRKNA
uniref:Uncharacterized protein n=1 Tax=Zea mays TaxID=4577 RepID=C4J877_MAIZE|nr:unknown [Zea mays]